MRFMYSTLGIIAAAIVELCALPGASLGYPQLKTLRSFCRHGSDCSDGYRPAAALLRDTNGVLYGTTIYGGHGAGLVFELVPNGGKYDYRILHKFCSKQGPPHCKDGASPASGVIEDVNGNLYGTAYGAGRFGSGNVYELIPDSGRRKFKLVSLYDFCPDQSACRDGAYPNGLTYQGQESGALYDGTSPLFGTTEQGGDGIGGVAFRLSYVSGQTARKEEVIYSFCARAGCPDGETPSRLAINSSGDLFGTTQLGGIIGNSAGTVFELIPAESGFSETVLHDFCSLANCADGMTPLAGVVQDAAGNLIGTTQSGGPYGNYGVLFKIAPNGQNSKESVLYNFCSQSNCTDGEQPQAEVTLDANGNVFGVTLFGGVADLNRGVMFELSGAGYTVLHSFCSEPNCIYGGSPLGGLTLGRSGFFGTTTAGGANDRGTVFRFRQ